MFHFFPSFLFFFSAGILYLSGVPVIEDLGLVFPVTAYVVWGLAAGTIRQAWGGVFVGWLFDAYSPHFFGAHALLFLSIAALLYLLKRYFVRRYFWGELIIITGTLMFSVVVFPLLLGLNSNETPSLQLTGRYLGEQLLLISITVAAMYGLLTLWFRKGAIESEPYAIS